MKATLDCLIQLHSAAAATRWQANRASGWRLMARGWRAAALTGRWQNADCVGRASGKAKSWVAGIPVEDRLATKTVDLVPTNIRLRAIVTVQEAWQYRQ